MVFDSTAMSRPSLTALSEELKVSIINYISLPADLKNLRLTCREIEPLATARLYHETTVDLWKWSQSNPLYRKGHNAHACIRYIAFKAKLSSQEDRENMLKMDSLRNGIKLLLQLLPHNLLKEFESPSLLPLHEEIISVLATTQDNIKTLKLGPLHGSYLALPESLKSWPRKVRFLENKGYVGDERDFQSYEKITRNSSRSLKELVVRAMGTEPFIEHFYEKMQDSEARDGLVSKMLQAQVDLKAETVTKIDLLMLVLQNVNLFYAGRTITPYVDFAGLSSLDLFTCPGAAKLLGKDLRKETLVLPYSLRDNMLTHVSFIATAVLTSRFRTQGNSIKGLTLCVAYGDEPEPTSFDCDILHDFIDCLSDLDYLTLDIWSLTRPFELRWIESHARTLERLYICIGRSTGSIDHCHGNDVLPLEDLQRLCGGFDRLKQVAICLPKIGLLFEVSDSKKIATYKSYLTALGSLPNLKILRIFTWTIAPLSSIRKVENRNRINPSIFDSFLEKFADMTVTHLTASPPSDARSKLRIVCFGDRHIWTLEGSDGERHRAHPRCYVVDWREGGVDGVEELPVVSKVTKRRRRRIMSLMLVRGMFLLGSG